MKFNSKQEHYFDVLLLMKNIRIFNKTLFCHHLVEGGLNEVSVWNMMFSLNIYNSVNNGEIRVLSLRSDRLQIFDMYFKLKINA